MARIWSSGAELGLPLTLMFNSQKDKDNFLDLLMAMEGVEFSCIDKLAYHEVSSIDVTSFPRFPKIKRLQNLRIFGKF